MSGAYSWADASGANLPLLRTTLQAAVPLRIAELAHLAPEDIQRKADSIDTHELHADDAMFAGRHAAEGVRNLITALALLAHAEGGVDFMGDHWCTDHARCLTVRGAA